jgi:hypothetical protein
MLCELDGELLLHICEGLKFQHVKLLLLICYRRPHIPPLHLPSTEFTRALQVMLLRRVSRSLRATIDAAIVPVVVPDEGHEPDTRCNVGGTASSIDSRPRVPLSSLLQLCCRPHLVMHTHSYGPNKAFAPALSSPSTLVGSSFPGIEGCGRACMSIGMCSWVMCALFAVFES